MQAENEMRNEFRILGVRHCKRVRDDLLGRHLWWLGWGQLGDDIAADLERHANQFHRAAYELEMEAACNGHRH